MALLKTNERAEVFDMIAKHKCESISRGHFCHFFDKRPIGVGTFRFAFAGRWCPHGDYKGEKGKCVVKKWIKAPIYEKNFFAKEMEAHALINQMITKWNRLKNADKKYSLTTPVQTMIKKAPKGGICNLSEYVVIEDYLEGEWNRFNGNTGSYQEGMGHLSVQGFCHFTFHER